MNIKTQHMAVQQNPEPTLYERFRAFRKHYFPTRRSLASLFAAFMVASIAFFSWYHNHQAVLANLTFGDLALSNMPHEEAIKQARAFVEEKNASEVEIIIRHRGSDEEEERFPKSLAELGFEYRLDARLEESVAKIIAQGTRQHGSAEEVLQLEGATALQLVIDYGAWNTFVKKITKHVERDPHAYQMVWLDEQGWILQEKQIGRNLDRVLLERSFKQLHRQLLKYDHINLDLAVITSPVLLDMSEEEEEHLTAVAEDIRFLSSEPFVLNLAGEEVLLDFNSNEDLISIDSSGVDLDEGEIVDWLEEIAEDFHRPTNTIRITGQEEVRPGAYKALTEGSFEEGRRIIPEAVYEQLVTELLDAEDPQRRIEVEIEEIPLKVYSELEDMEYELLSVGYSEYSTGNGANRVHNIQTGLHNINTSLIDQGAEISFNRMNGIIGSDFRVGYAIFGNEAKPSLGGGICQVSTTFYRGLLNLGVPITQRQNHSWDLSYYQTGGYGLDATIYPPRGLDVKAVNDLPSQLFIYSYTRPETEEAFVLFYGKNDGREVSLEPYKDYKPFYGAKTLKWTQRIEWPDGTVKENDIISRYRS